LYGGLALIQGQGEYGRKIPIFLTLDRKKTGIEVWISLGRGLLKTESSGWGDLYSFVSYNTSA
jgi:hypothetical protein